MSTIKAENLQLGDHATATNNFTLTTNLDGTAVLARGNQGATTQDILTIDASGNILFPADTNVNSAANGSSMALLSTKTASASATIDFTTELDSTYNRYVIHFDDVVPATNGALLQTRISQASTWVTAGYYWAVNGVHQGSANVPVGDIAATHMRIGTSLSTSAGYACSGELTITSPSSTTLYKTIHGQCQFQNTANGVTMQTFAGYHLTSTAALDGFRFLMDSGNITSGTFKLYGIK